MKANKRSAESSSRIPRKRNRCGAGDLVLFGKYTSQEVKVDGEDYLLMLEDEVLAVIDDVGVTRTK